MPSQFGLYLFTLLFGFAVGRVARWVDFGLSTFLRDV